MFRDIAEAKPEREYSIDIDYSRCPYCESFVTEEYERKPTKNGMWIESRVCEICGNPYTIVYNEDQTFSHIIRDRVKLNISKRGSGRSLMSKLKCRKCGALAHRVIEGVPYCNKCIPHEEYKENVKDLVIECGCGNTPPIVFTSTPSDEEPKEVPTEGCCSTEKKSFWKKLFCKSNLY